MLENKKEFILCLAVFFSILSQAPFLRLVLNINTTITSAPFWIISALIGIFTLKRTYLNRETKIVIALFLLFFFTIVLYEGITGNSYVFSYVTKPIYFSFFFFVLGSLFSRQVSNELIKKIAFSYIAATTIISLDIFIEYFLGTDITAVTYIFRSKNSASSILLIAVIFCLYAFYPRNIWMNILKILLISFFTFLIVIMRARAVLISMLLIPIAYLLLPRGKRTIKISILGAMLVGLVTIFASKTVFNFLINNILLKATNSNNVNMDINYLTSNRFYEVLYSMYLFELNPLFGKGYYYVDFFAVNSFVNYGFIAGLLLIIISVCPLLFCYRQFSKKNCFLYFMIALVCLINGLFEGLAPFGPGNKFFILWILFGLMCNMDEDILNRYSNSVSSYETKTFVELRI